MYFIVKKNSVFQQLTYADSIRNYYIFFLFICCYFFKQDFECYRTSRYLQIFFIYKFHLN